MRETVGNKYKIFSPVEVMTNLNRHLTEQELSGHQFITCCYCILNIKTLELRFARAGHPYPIIIRPGQEPQLLESKGTLLGVFENPQFDEGTVQLQRGDKLLLYSDGALALLGSLKSKAGLGFNEELYQIKDLPIVEMVKQFDILVENKEFKPSELDDITLVALEIN